MASESVYETSSAAESLVKATVTVLDNVNVRATSCEHLWKLKSEWAHTR